MVSNHLIQSYSDRLRSRECIGASWLALFAFTTLVSSPPATVPILLTRHALNAKFIRYAAPASAKAYSKRQLPRNSSGFNRAPWPYRFVKNP